MYVVDTNVISELLKRQPDKRVMGWLDKHADELLLPSITIEELRFGQLLLDEGKKSRALARGIDALVLGYASRILPFDTAAAEQCARYHEQAISCGRTPTIEDLMIAAICACGGHTLATGNVRDFSYLDLPVVNPFE